MPPPEESQSLKDLLATLDDTHREWKANFTKLNEFRKRNDNASPSINDNANLGIAQWAHEQRVRYKAGMLDETRSKCLEQINFIFRSTSNGTISKKVESDNEKWDAKLQVLMAYKKKHGDCLVPRNHPELGTWVNSQRKAYNNVKADNNISKITQERVDKLNAIGFCR